MASKGFRFSMIQLLVGKDKASNLLRAGKLIREAASKGAQVIALPECFNSPYGTSYFPAYTEPIPGESTDTLAGLAKETKTYLIGGSIPERDGDKLYNTCTVFNPDGELIAKYRKMHLFDIDVPGKIRFQESETLSPGSGLAKFETKWCTIGLGICYDLRFPELARLYALEGCKFVCFPGAFNMTTGPVHWELLIRSRALDNQVYAAGVSVARDETASYISWANSTLVSPWGEVMVNAGDGEMITCTDIDIDHVADVRQKVPVLQQRRTDLYELKTTY